MEQSASANCSLEMCPPKMPANSWSSPGSKRSFSTRALRSRSIATDSPSRARSSSKPTARLKQIIPRTTRSAELLVTVPTLPPCRSNRPAGLSECSCHTLLPCCLFSLHDTLFNTCGKVHSLIGGLYDGLSESNSGKHLTATQRRSNTAAAGRNPINVAQPRR